MEHSGVLLTCIKVPHGFKAFVLSILSDCLRQVSLYVAGTLFLEVWKRKQAELAYQWDVEQFEENEPDRPSFYGTKTRIVCFSLIQLSKIFSVKLQ